MAEAKEMSKIFNKGGGDPIGIALQAVGVFSDIKEGKGVVKSVAKGAFDYVMFDAMSAVLGGPLTMALTLAPALVEGAGAMADVGRGKAKHNMKAVSNGNIGGGFVNNNKYAATMRQRQLQQMGGDISQQRQLFGSEARRRATNIAY